MSDLPRPRRAAGATVAAFAALELGYAIWAAFFAHSPVGPRVGYGPDSAVYIASARAPVWSHHFLSGPGAFGFLLLAKLCARNLRAIVIVQSVLSIAAWTLLATTVCGIVRTNAARWLALAALLGTALAPGILQWNAFITTESLSLSTLCIVVAFALRAVTGARRRDVAGLVVASAAFAYTRDTNALVVGALAVGVLALVGVRLVTRRALWTAGLAVGVAGLVFAYTATSLANAAQPPRWYWPVAETTSIRLLADPVATRYLVDHGFPLDAQTRSLPTRYVFIVSQVTDTKDPTFAAFRRWVRVDGRRVYLDFLVSHPHWALRKPFDDREALFDLGVIEGYGSAYRNHLGAPFSVVGAVAAPRPAPVAEVWLLLAAVALVALAWRRAVSRALAGSIAATGLLALLAYYAAWHGDALEVYRHALSATVQLRITMWIVTVLVVDALVARGRARSTIEVPDEADLDEDEHERAPAGRDPREQQLAGAGGDLAGVDLAGADLDGAVREHDQEHDS